MHPPKRKQSLFIVILLGAALVSASLCGVRQTFAVTKTALLQVTARVRAYVQVNLLAQAAVITVTEEDIRKGYVEMPSASRLQIKTNSNAGYLIAFESQASPFAEAQVFGLHTPVLLNAGNAVVFQPSVRGTNYLDLSYRFIVPKTLQPGLYPWPISITVQAG